MNLSAVSQTIDSKGNTVFADEFKDFKGMIKGEPRIHTTCCCY